MSGTFTVNTQAFGGEFTIVGGMNGTPVTAGSAGADVTLDAGGSLAVVNSGTIVTGPAIPTTSVAAAPGAGLASMSPGLAGTAGIQPQLNVDALVDAFAIATE